jgi:hypothetical protein
MVLCPLWTSPPSTVLCSTSTALYPLYDPLSLLQPLSPLWLSVSSKALCTLWALCPLYCPLSPLGYSSILLRAQKSKIIVLLAYVYNNNVHLINMEKLVFEDVQV